MKKDPLGREKLFASTYAKHITKTLYSVKIPDILSMNPEYLKKMGYGITGNRVEDAWMKNRECQVMIPISNIAEYLDAGIQVKILDHADMIEMYKNISGYLGEWRQYLQSPVNVYVGGMEDILRSLDRLNRLLYDQLTKEDLVTRDRDLARTFGIVGPLWGQKGKRHSQQNMKSYDELNPDINRTVYERTKSRER